VGVDPRLAAAFQPTRPNHFQCDLFAIARQQLAAAGVDSVHGGGHCTFSEADRFFSYRRDGGAGRDTGRIATLLWLTR
jgi:polyphenol oxidase